jgi:hypothetical protein
MTTGGSNYLDGAEELYGLPPLLPPGVAQQASAIVDAELKRPEGIIYVCDGAGNPSYMKALIPVMTLQIVGAVTAGAKVTVTVKPAIVRPDMVGEVLVLDRINPDLCESVVVASTVGTNQLVFANVQFNHADKSKADIGLVITEERSCPARRSVVRYSKFPCPAILSLMGRYAYGRRSEQASGNFQEMNLLASVQAFGGPPQWVPISISSTSWSDATGEIWVPAGALLAYYSDVKIKYVAGFADPPDPIVKATAFVAQSLIGQAKLGGGSIKVLSAGDTRIEKFGSTNIDDDTRRLLEPFKARVFY